MSGIKRSVGSLLRPPVIVLLHTSAALALPQDVGDGARHHDAAASLDLVALAIEADENKILLLAGCTGQINAHHVLHRIGRSLDGRIFRVGFCHNISSFHDRAGDATGP